MKRIEVKVDDEIITIYDAMFCLRENIIEIIRDHQPIGYFHKWDYCLLQNEDEDENQPS